MCREKKSTLQWYASRTKIINSVLTIFLCVADRKKFYPVFGSLFNNFNPSYHMFFVVEKVTLHWNIRLI